MTNSNGNFHTFNAETHKSRPPFKIIAIILTVLLLAGARFALKTGATAAVQAPSDWKRAYVAQPALEFEALMALAAKNQAPDDVIREFIQANPVRGAAQIKKRAKSGDTAAQVMYCWMSMDGIGIKPNPREAMQMCQSAAGNNNPAAFLNIAYMYQYGVGVEPNAATAAQHRQFAFAANKSFADAGQGRAAMRAAYAYESGSGTAKDMTKALAYYKKGAALGNAEAQCSAGRFYANNMGGAKDENLALEYYTAAADQGYLCAIYALSIAYQDGKLGAKKDITAAQKYRALAAENGHAPALYDMAISYGPDGEHSHDAAKAFGYMLESAERGNVSAMRMTAENYAKGRGTAANDIQAALWYEMAAKRGDSMAAIHLAELQKPPTENYKDAEDKAVAYIMGKGVEKNQTEAVKWLKTASSQGSVLSMMTLSKFHKDGDGLEKSDVAAMYWLLRAVEVKPGYLRYAEEHREAITDSELERAMALVNKCSAKRFYACSRGQL